MFGRCCKELICILVGALTLLLLHFCTYQDWFGDNFDIIPKDANLPRKFGNAYIITTQPSISDDQILTAIDCGFIPIHIPAIQPFAELHSSSRQNFSSCLVAKDNSVDLESIYYSQLKISLAEIALICSHRKVWNRIAADEDSSDTDWSLILEADARINPMIRSSAQQFATRVLDVINTSKSDSIHEDSSYGFIYFGLCHGKCRGVDPSKTIGFNCLGYCTHAYAITKHRAKTFHSELYDNQKGSARVHYRSSKDLIQIDQAFHSHFYDRFHNQSHSKGPMALFAGYHLLGPTERNHKGIMYQANKLAPSTLTAKNAFVPLRCFRLVATGRLGNLMFLYAALIGLCTKHQMAAEYCAELIRPLQPVNPVELPLETFWKTFKIQNGKCPLPMDYEYEEHKMTPYATEYDPLVLQQPVGTILKGYFQSFRYFEHPDAQRAVRLQYQFPIESTRVAHQFLSKARMDYEARLFSTNYSLVCMAVRRGDKVNNTFYNQWALGLDYYTKAIDYLGQKEQKPLLVVVFLGGTLKESAEDLKDRKNFLRELRRQNHSFVLSSGHSIHFIADSAIRGDHVSSMRAISMCPNIIVAASSYSWWAAYLSAKGTAIVAPGDVHSMEKFVETDYYPSHWHVIHDPH